MSALFKISIFKISPLAISFICLPLIYNRLDLEVIGVFERLMFINAFIVLILKFSIPSVYFRSCYENPKKSIGISNSFESVILLAYLLLFGILIVFLESSLQILFFISSIGLVTLEFIRRDIQYRENYGNGICIVFFTALLLQVLKIILVFFYSKELASLLISEIIVNFSYLIIYFFYRSKYIFSGLSSFKYLIYLVEEFKYLSSIYIHHLISFVFQYLNKIVTILYLSSSDMAILSLGLKFILPFSLLIDVFCFYFMPKVFKGYKNKNKSILLSLTFTLIFIPVYFLTLESLILILFEERYHLTISLLPILLFGIYFNFAYRLISIDFFYSKKLMPVILSTVLPMMVCLYGFYGLNIEPNLIIVSGIFLFQSLFQFLILFSVLFYKKLNNAAGIN